MSPPCVWNPRQSHTSMNGIELVRILSSMALANMSLSDSGTNKLWPDYKFLQIIAFINNKVGL